MGGVEKVLKRRIFQAGGMQLVLELTEPGSVGRTSQPLLPRLVIEVDDQPVQRSLFLSLFLTQRFRQVGFSSDEEVVKDATLGSFRIEQRVVGLVPLGEQLDQRVIRI